MTKEEVMELSNDELRIRAAGLLGAEDIDKSSQTGELMGCWLNKEGGGGKVWKRIEDYPNDIVAAMELEEIARAAGWLLTLRSFMTPHWEAEFARYDEPVSHGEIEPTGKVETGGSSPGQAITRAFILAMTKDFDQGE